MGLIVQKFGGTSVADAERVMNVARIVTDTYKQGNKVVVVVSAQGDTTDDLIEKAKEINPSASKRELDMLMTAGEQISISLLAMAIQKLGYPVISLLGWQAGFVTSSVYGSARIRRIETDRLHSELDQNRIVVVAGFQGLNKYDDMTTLGRGGSDTSAVAIAAALRADRCQIFTDVEGVYTADPRKVETAVKLSEITYDEMLSLVRKPGTIVKEKVKMEKMLISGVAKDTHVARISLLGLPDEPGIAFQAFSRLASKNINVDIILQSIGRDGTKDISFTVAEDCCEDAEVLMQEFVASVGGKGVALEKAVAKVSIVGAGMETHAGVAAKMFEALYGAHINIRMISTSEIKISVLINEEDADKAVSAIHAMFIG